MHPTLSSAHLHRDASIYIRQSTGQQVRAHPDSGRRQDALAAHARVWGFAHVTLIEADVGRSGAGHHQRPGFGPRLAAVGAGRVSAVFALEAARLARHNRDWHHVIDLGALTDTVRIDDDGGYDPRQLHDRLVRGRKGSRAADERGVLRQRARQACEAKSERGQVMWEGPGGFVRTADDRIEQIADRQVQPAGAGVFETFRALGRARQTTRW